MPLKLKWKSRDDVPEELRDQAKEVDGEFHVELETTPELKNAHERQKTKNQEQADKIRDLERQLAGKKAGLTDEEIAARRTEIDTAVKPVQEKLTSAEAELRALKLDANVKSMLAKAGANPKRIDDLFKLTGERYDLSESGKPVLKSAPTTDLDKYITETVAKEYPELFLSGQKGGAAVTGSGDPVPSAELEKLVIDNPSALLAMANAK